MTVLIRIMRVDDEPSVTKGGLRKSGSLGSSAPQPMAYQYGLCKVSQAEPDRHADLATMEVIAHVHLLRFQDTIGAGRCFGALQQLSQRTRRVLRAHQE